MRIASKFITVLLSFVIIATAVGVGYGLFAMLSAAEDADGEAGYEIYLPAQAELYSDRPFKLTPEFFNESGMPVNAKFTYSYESEAISIAADGSVTVTDPTFTGEIAVLVTEQVTGIQKSITLRVVSELTYVNEVLADGAPITATREMEIGKSYRFELVTVPAAVATADYFDFYVTDENGARAEAFLCCIEGNSVYMTANALGSGALHFVMENEARGLYFEQEVAFSVSTPDPVFGQAILGAAGDTLIATDELPAVCRAIFPAEVGEIDFASSEFFPNLYALVFLADTPVSATALPAGTVVRVNGEDLYRQYTEDDVWGAYADRIFPFLDGDHTRPVAVYHNADSGRDTLIQAGLLPGQDGYSIEHIANHVYDYISATSPALGFGYAEDGTAMPLYALDGYRFVGWKTAEGARVDGHSSVEEGIHLYAAWEAKEYTLTLEDYNSGELTYTVTYREAIGELPTPVKPGWRFSGWYLSEEYVPEEAASANDERTAYCLTEGITLYAKYVADITLNYQTVEPGELPTVLHSAVYGKPLSALPALTDYYEWEAGGWFTSEGYRAEEAVLATDAFTYENADGITLYAKYTFETTFHTLSELLTESVFDKIRVYSGLTLGESLAVEGREMPVCTDRDASKWRFDGWTATLYRDGFLFGELDSSSHITEDSLFQPGMTDIYPVFRSTVTLKAGINGEVTLGTLPVVYGCHIGELPASVPVIPGFTADGWYDATRHKLTATDTAFYDDGAATYAVWYNAVEYSIKANNAQGAAERESMIPFWAIGESDTDHVLNNDRGSGVTGRDVLLPLIPDLDGYTEYWTWELVEIAAPKDLTAHGYTWTVGADVYRNIYVNYYYKPNTYTVTFDVFGAPVEYEKSVDILFASDTKLPVPEAPEGYIFDGWFLDSGLADKDRYDASNRHLIPHDFTLYARFVKTVEFVGYRGSFSYTLVYAKDYTVPDSFFGAPSDYEAETSAWRFVGWEDADGKLITEGVADYRRTDTVYKSVFMRDLKLSLPDGFSLPEGMNTVTVRRGMTLYQQNIVLPSNADIAKTGDALDWTLLGWYFWHPNMENTAHDVSLSDPVDIMDGAVDTLYGDFSNFVTLNLVYPSGHRSEEITVAVRLGFPLAPIFDKAAKNFLEEEYGRGYYHIGWQYGDTVWDKTQNEAGYAAFVAEVSHTFGTTFTALFKPNPYTVNYDPSGGSEVPSADMTFGDEITLASAPSRLGYFFLGWENSLTGDLYAAGEVLSNLTTSGSITLTAKWRALEYDVEYYAPDADEPVLGIHAVYGTPFALPAPTRVHYNFKGWMLGGTVYAAGEEVTDLTATEGETVTLTAIWEPKLYQITFRDAQGGARCYRYFTVEKRSIDAPSDTPAVIGYIGAWEDYSERLATLSEDFEVQAVYTPITYTLQYEGLLVNNEYTLTYDTSAKVTTSFPQKTGYEFLGWTINGVLYERGAKILNLTAEDGATVIATPTYRIFVYTVIFYGKDGEEVARENFTVEEPEITAPAVPQRTGYTAKWGDYSPKYDVDPLRVYPIYDLITYTVEFYADGNFIARDTYTVEDMSVAVPENGTIPPKTGYKDGRWPNFAPDAENPADVRVDALYTPISYRVVLDAFGVYYKEMALTYDVPAYMPADIPNKAGHTFNGWRIQDDLYVPGQEFLNLTAEDGAIVKLTGDYRMHSYSVYYSNGVLYKTVMYDEPVELPMTTVVNKPGYTFKSWYINEYLDNVSGGDRFGALTAEDNGKVILQENWTENSYVLYLVDAFGNKYLEKILMYTEVYTLPKVPSSQRAEYNFHGWTYRMAGSSTTNGVGAGGQVGRLVAENGGSIVLTEQWTVKTPTVTFNYNGGSGGTSSKTVTYNSTYGTLPSPNSRTNYTFNGWFTAASGGTKVTSNTKVSNYNNHTLYAQWTYVDPGPDTCVATGTEVLLADGTVKRIEELTGEEMLMVWDFYTGAYVARPILLLINHGEAEYEIINLCFADGTRIRVVGKHTFYDLDLRMFVCLDSENYRSYLGHSFAKTDGDGNTGVKLVDVYVTAEHTGSYSVWTAGTVNFVADGFLSITPTATGFDNFGIACDENMRYDGEQMKADIEKYGLYTYEEWADCLTYEQFMAFNGPYMKIAVGKGFTSEEELRLLISLFVNPATE